MKSSLTSKRGSQAGVPLSSPWLTACLISAWATAQAGAAVIPPVTEDFDQVGWLDLSGSYVWVDGRDATFRQRHQTPSGAFGGVESFFWENFLSRDLTMVIEGRSIFDQNDNLLSIRFTKNDTGFVNFGFRESRTFYDGSGGYFRPNDLWFEPQDGNMFIDRGDFWIEGGLRRPDVPAITLRYNHSYRRGLKDSTVWGRAAVTGVEGNNRAMMPSFREIDETKHVFDASGSHALGNTDLGIGLRYEQAQQDNTLNWIQQTQGQNSPLAHNEKQESDAWSGRAWTRTELNEKTQLSTAYMYTRLDTDIGGSRLFANEALRGMRDYHLTDIRGGSKVNQHVANVSLIAQPWEQFYIIPSLRAEKQEIDSVSRFTQTYGPPNFTVHDNDLTSSRDVTEFAQRLELRYNGFARLHLFARGDWMQADGDLTEQFIDNGQLDLDRLTDFERKHQTYTVGAQWYPARRLTFSGQYAYKIRENDYDHVRVGAGQVGRHPAFLQMQDFTTHAFNIRATVRPTSGVSLVSRYDLELTEIKSQGSLVDNGEQVANPLVIKSGERTRHVFSQSASWMPIPRLYLLGSINYAIDELETPASNADGDAAGLVLDQKNDYLFANVGLAFAYTERTDLNLDYFYYIADNYRDNSERSQPYGVGEREHGVRLGMVYRIDDNLLWKVGYGFFTYRDKGTWGGNRDYDAHFAHTGLTVHF